MRPTIFGNPFKLQNYDRETSLASFEKWVRKQPRILEAIRALKDEDILVCCCKPKLCHGDIIVKIWGELNSE